MSGPGYMPGVDPLAVMEEARVHYHATAGIPFEPGAGECEVCDALWLIDNNEGAWADQIYALRDALEAQP